MRQYDGSKSLLKRNADVNVVQHGAIQWLWSKKDYNEAFRWYKAVADQGYKIGQYNIGLFYKDGKGVNKIITRLKYI